MQDKPHACHHATAFIRSCRNVMTFDYTLPALDSSTGEYHHEVTAVVPILPAVAILHTLCALYDS
jgi:hypothetical protein